MSEPSADNSGYRRRSRRALGLGCVALLFAFQSILGITWGLPSRSIDKYLFPDGDVWSGEKIHRLANAGGKFDPSRGADVDADPLAKVGDEPIPLTATDEDVAKILLRYRLYTHQPDEMITMMALAGMKPGRFEFDPKLYQYGGLFIYPTGALIKLCGVLGLIDVRADVVYYLDNPDEFGKFYVVARAYAAAWGLVGVIAVYLIGRRMSSGAPPTRGGATSDNSHRVGLLAALLFTLLPVVVCMSHEGKPHLPGAVLMLIAVYLAMRCGDKRTAKPFWWMGAACGAAVGMVLSSWPICVLIPLVAIRAVGASPRTKLVRVVSGGVLAVGVYLLTNPYVLINAFTNREVLRSNFGNSLAMYEVTRIGEGFLRVIELTAEGATWPVFVLGVVGLVARTIRGNRAATPLITVAAVFFLQFVLIGAGKPAEYGRFGIFTNTVLAIGSAMILFPLGRSPGLAATRGVFVVIVIGWSATAGVGYLRNFQIDSSPTNSRIALVDSITGWTRELRHTEAPLYIALLAEPAPYNCPPMPFASTDVRLVRSPFDAVRKLTKPQWWLVHPSDSMSEARFGLQEPKLQEFVSDGDAWWATPISWANKPFFSENSANFVPLP